MRSMPMGSHGHDYDVVVIGSGFGGSVTALRLTEKGYRVGVLEAGRRFADDEFAKTSWRVRKYLWAPKLGCYGILRMTLLKDTFVAAGAGVGGGSLVFANTLYRPPDAFYRDPQWAHITDWKAELAPYYDLAERMLGVTDVPHNNAADDLLHEVARDIGKGDTFRRTRVGVVFGDRDQPPGTRVPDPFFGGAGPPRNTCLNCGECVVGCRHNAKNTTVKNYLYLAERAGAAVHPLTTVTGVRPLRGGGYAVETVRSGAWLRKHRRTFTAEQRRVLRGGARYPTPAASDQGRWHAAASLAAAWASHAHELRSDHLRTIAAQGRRLPQRRWRSPPRSIPTATPTSRPAGSAARAATCCR